MKKEQKAYVQWCANLQQQELQQLERGEWPEWATHRTRALSPTLNERRMYADWCLDAILRSLVSTLPGDIRAMVQACCDLRERIWSTAYLNAYYDQAHKETSPHCLQASDSL